MPLAGAPLSSTTGKDVVRRTEQPFWRRIAALVGLLVVGLAALLALDPIPQDPAYHAFADRRPLLGVPNFNDVVSNAGFAAVGVLGILVVAGRRRGQIFAHRSDAWPYALFFAGVALVSLGSAYYHWAPSNDRLLWDRLPMSVAFMAFCAAIVADRVDRKAGNTWLLAILVGLGILSLAYWHWSESQGHGDLRFYGFVQFFPIVAVPAVCWLFPQYRYVASRYIVWMIGWYGLSKLLERFDGQVFELLGHTVSGHTLKHVAAAVATLVVLQMLLLRREADTP